MHPIAPDRRELAPQVPEGASGSYADGLLLGWYLIEVIDTPISTAVTTPGGAGKERFAESYRAK